MSRPKIVKPAQTRGGVRLMPFDHVLIRCLLAVYGYRCLAIAEANGGIVLSGTTMHGTVVAFTLTRDRCTAYAGCDAHANGLVKGERLAYALATDWVRAFTELLTRV